MKRILITGGAGFIGSHLAVSLNTLGYEVRILDCLSPQIHGNDPKQSSLYRTASENGEIQHGDVTNRDDLIRALEGADAVVHLAAETGTGQSMYAIQHYVDTNVGGTSLLLDLIAEKELELEKLVVASSRAVYGEGKYICEEHGIQYPGARLIADMDNGDFEVHCPACHEPVAMLPTDENTPFSPSSVYGITKQTQEQLVLTVGSSLRIPSVALRYQNVYGPGQSLKNPYTGILSIFSTRIRNGKDISIFEDGMESRDFVYIDDVVRATVAALESGDGVEGVFNVGSGCATTVETVVETLCRKLDIEAHWDITGNFRIGDIRHNLAGLDKVSSVLGYYPSISFDEGIGRFAQWVLGESIGADGFDASIRELKEKGLFK